MEIEDRARVVELIESVIAADGVVAGEERDFLRRVVQRFGLTERERADFPVPSDAGRTTAMLRALAPGVQTRVMALLVEAAVVDGTVAPEERALLLASAAALGIEAAALEERIAQRLKAASPSV